MKTTYIQYKHKCSFQTVEALHPTLLLLLLLLLLMLEPLASASARWYPLYAQ
jgi:hypothetical protein